jgi:hypothetical protein
LPPPDADITAVTGTVTRTWVDEAGQTLLVEPEDISKDTYAALVPDSAAPGSYKVLTATQTGTGSFIIPGVHPPTGQRITYLLKRTRPDVAPGLVGFDAISDASVTINRIVPSRPGGAPATQASLINFDIAAMSAWQSTDFLEIFCANIAAFDFEFEQTLVTTWPMAGATHFTSSLDWMKMPAYSGALSYTPLIAGSLGDQLLIAHMTTKMSPTNISYQAVTETAIADPFDQVDGKAQAVATVFTKPAQAGTLQVVVKQGDFQMQASEVNPRAQNFDGDLAIDLSAMPGDASGERQIGATADTIIVNLPLGTTDVDTGVMTYAPYPSTWGEFVSVTQSFHVTYTIPGATNKPPHGQAAFVNIAKKDLPANHVVAPLISPPRNVLLNGMPLTSSQTLPYAPTGPAPLLSWDAPRLGASQWYLIRVLRYDVTNMTAKRVLVGSLTTTNLSVRLPWDLFAAASYELDVYSNMATGLTNTFQLPMFPSAGAVMMSELVTFTAP